MALTDLTHIWLEVPLLPVAAELLDDGVVLLAPAAPPEPPHANVAPAQAIIASSAITYDAALLDAAPRLRIIARGGIGLDNVDVEAATQRGIAVCNTPDGPTESTAEHTVAMMLALAKRIKQGNVNLAAGQFGPRTGLLGSEVQGKTLGLIGLGRIGRRVAEICRLGLQMRVLAYDPFVSAERAGELGVGLADLDTVIAEADVLSLHLPLTPDTRHLIDRERIALMKDGAYLLNLARGPLVDEAALLDALEAGKLAGAGLDAFETEPLPADSPWRDHPDVIATPHTASVTAEGRARTDVMAVQEVLAFFNGQRPANVVNPEVLDQGAER